MYFVPLPINSLVFYPRNTKMFILNLPDFISLFRLQNSDSISDLKMKPGGHDVILVFWSTLFIGPIHWINYKKV